MKIVEIPGAIEVEDMTKNAGSVSFRDFLMLHLDTYAEIKTPKQIRQAQKIADAVEGANGTLSLEDADYELLSAACQKSVYIPKVARKLIPFWDALEKAEEVKK